MVIIGANSNQALAAESSNPFTEVNSVNQEVNSKGTFNLIETNNSQMGVNYGLVMAEIPVSGGGPSGIVGVSGIADVMNCGLSKGTLYTAQLTGVAEAEDGTTYSKVPNAKISFAY